MKISLLEPAQIELDETIEYYNYESHGLGDDFLIEFLTALDKIGKFPEAWQACTNNNKKISNTTFSIWNYLSNT